MSQKMIKICLRTQSFQVMGGCYVAQQKQSSFVLLFSIIITAVSGIWGALKLYVGSETYPQWLLSAHYQNVRVDHLLHLFNDCAFPRLPSAWNREQVGHKINQNSCNPTNNTTVKLFIYFYVISSVYLFF